MRLVPRRDHLLRRTLRATGREGIRILGLKRRRRIRVAPVAMPPVAGAPRIVYVSGEPGTAGHSYRVARCAASAAEAGYAVEVVNLHDLAAHLVVDPTAAPAAVVIWRAAWNEILERAVTAWRAAGSRILFDVDDYMFDPGLARAEVIDGIRSQGIPEARVVEHYARIRTTLSWADACIAPTERLAEGMQACDKTAMILCNGFDDEVYRVSREAVLRRRSQPGDGLLRIGYASGSRTHQRDFTIAAPAVARVLRTRPDCRLVLFRDTEHHCDLLDVGEFPELQPVLGQIEWRPRVPLAGLPEELVRFDVNLAPLEVGNVYCEAKSELKYFEAALVEVPTVASPTQPFRAAIAPGCTGLLADDAADWERHLRHLLDDAAARRAMGRAALLDVLHRYGPDGRRLRVANVFDRVLGTAAERAAAFGVELEPRGASPRLPPVPEADVVRAYGDDRVADVGVVVPVFNYERYVAKALDSVAAQTLERIELVIVDDCSTDRSLEAVDAWLARRWRRFVRATLLRNRGNQGLPLTRNAGFARAEAPLVMPLDADNMLEPRCLELLCGRLAGAACAAVHPTLQRFGKCTHRHVAQPWSPDRLRHGNYIDAMALIRRSAWAHVGGYTKGEFVGWEDYDLWCKFVEAGLWSDPVPEAVALYRVHAESMLNTRTNTGDTLPEVVRAIRAAHPWLRVRAA